MALEMKPGCERCGAALSPGGTAFICSFECTFCADCAGILSKSARNTALKII